ncbi:MAG: insulinase family protein [Hyphomicrobiales bacterium]|nr:insulinase family protein [Hyphomicrobiales bacterium]
MAPIEEASRAARVQEIRTPGGVSAWLIEDYAVPLVAMQFAFRGGAAQDPKSKPGVATLLSGLLDEGAGPYDSAGFHEALDDIAAHLQFSADRDYLGGHFQTLTKNLDPAFELLRLAVNEARLEQGSIERVASQLAASLRRELKDPDSVAARSFRAAAFPDHPYGRAARGEIDVLPQIGRDDLIDLRARTLARDNLLVGVVGAIDAATLSERLDRAFAALPATSRLEAITPVTMSGVGRRVVTEVDVPQTTIRFGRPSLDRHDPDFAAAIVVNHILGGGVFTARLFREVREKRGLAYSVYSHLQNNDAASMLLGGTSTKNERAAESLAVIEEQIRDLADNGPGDEELEKARKFLIGSYALRFDTSTKIAGNLLQLQLERRAPAYLDQRNRLIAAVTLEDAKRAAKRLFGDGKLLVAAAGRPVGM